LPDLTAQMLTEKATDPSPRIFRRLFVIPNVDHSQRFEPPNAALTHVLAVVKTDEMCLSEFFPEYASPTAIVISVA
jgi:hypothetical protein